MKACGNKMIPIPVQALFFFYTIIRRIAKCRPSFISLFCKIDKLLLFFTPSFGGAPSADLLLPHHSADRQAMTFFYLDIWRIAKR
jgi:hypothetical protein